MLQFQFRKNIAVFVFFLFFFVVLMTLYVRHELDPVNTQVYLNKFHNEYLDLFMVWFTHLGDVWILPVLVLVYWIRNKTYAVRFFFTGLSLTPVVFLLKRIFVAQRPVAVFEQLGRRADLYLLPDQHADLLYSFPSGHAAISFAIATIFACQSPKSVRKMFWMFFGACLSLSRVYLNEHFLMDVLFGGFLGVFFAFLVHVYCAEQELKLKSQQPWWMAFFATKE